MNDADDKAYQIASERLGLGSEEILALEPVLVPLMRSKFDLKLYHVWIHVQTK